MSDKAFNMFTKDKSDKKAEKFRKIGNKHFDEKDWFNALFNYNASIAFAKSKHVASLGYGNRSAVYLEIERFEDCLKNIQWARENGYPESKMPKLIKREEKCKNLMKESKESFIDPWDFFKLSYPENKKIPWLVDRVEMRHTKKFGRGIYAKKDLKPGDVICIEDPVIKYVNDRNIFMCCFSCMKSNAMNLIPCDQTGNVLIDSSFS